MIGLLGPPVVIVTLLGFAYARYGDIEWLRRALAGIAASAAGLIIAVLMKMSEPIFRRPIGFAPFVAVAAFVTVGVLRWPMPYVLSVLAPLSIALAFWRLPK